MQCDWCRRKGVSMSRAGLLLRLLGAAAGMAVGLSACETLQVTSDVNSALVGSVHCHSFAFTGEFRGDNPLRTGIANPLNETRLRAAITAQMQAHGAQPATSNPECLVGYAIGSRRVLDADYYTPWGYGWGWGWGGGWPYGPGPWPWVGPYVYHESVIAINLYDGRTGQPFWHASVPESLHDLTGVKAEQHISAAVEALFKKYPG